MSKIRVLVVDDSVTIRKLVSTELAADPLIEVVGTAANGKIALARITQLSPDLITLDVEMPEMDGIEALREIRKTHPKLPVIMFSALTVQGAKATLDALALGATDYFTKPSGGSIVESSAVLRNELIPAIKAICKQGARILPPFPLPAPRRTSRIEAVAVGTSTGGPNALTDLFAGLPADFPVPIAIVQHMPPMFTRLLAERLSSKFALKVEEGRAGGELKPGHAWVAPGDFHMTVQRDGTIVRVALNQDPPENSCRPAADVLFRSMAQVYGSGLLAVVMTGMGQDGLRGCEAVREAGGQIIVQDEASSVVWGMPGFVAKAGLADKILPLSGLAEEILQRVRVGRGAAR